MKKKAPLPVALILLLCVFSAFLVADDPVEKAVGALKKYVEEFPQEKVYLHLDKPYYSAGELMWIKAYLLAGSYHQPSPLSHTIRIEVLNSQKEIVHEAKLRSEKGFAQGMIALNDSVPTGSYVIRAYTPWMQNFGHDYFFQKEIRILNGNHPNRKALNDLSPDVQFFPEGGNLLEGLRNRIAFKAVAATGLGKKVQMKIVDEANVDVVTAESNDLGMGAFFLTPQPSKKYKAVLQSGVSYDLPAAQKAGFLMAVTNKADQKEVVVRVQTTEATQNRDAVILMVQCRGVVGFVAKLDLSKNLFYVKVPKDRMLSGINQLTLFTAQGTPVAERLVFINQQDVLTVNIRSDKPAYKPREKVNLDVKVTNKEGKGMAGSFSLTIVDDEQVGIDPYAGNIQSYLWLSSDLKGHIERPGYYFDPQNKDAFEALDMLMLTQGWRRFVWKDIMDDKWPEIKHPIDRGLHVSGRLLDILTKKPIAGGKVIYLQPGGDIIMNTTNEKGEFRFENLSFTDTAEVVIQGENKRGNKAVVFEFDKNNTSDVSFPSAFFQHDITAAEKKYDEETMKRRFDPMYSPDGKTITLQAVEISATRIEERAVEKMYGTGTNSLKVSKVPTAEYAVHPLQMLQGRFPGVQISGSGMNYTVSIRGTGSFSGGTTPLIMVDNVQVDIGTLSALRPRDIESIEVFKGADAAIFGSQGGNGAILFYTKKGGFNPSTRQGIHNLQLGGYAAPREFYSPKYDMTLPEHARPDKRATIFWQPMLQTDSTGSAKISFYNHDNETTVTGMIEGISGFGNPGASTFQYSISKQ